MQAKRALPRQYTGIRVLARHSLLHTENRTHMHAFARIGMAVHSVSTTYSTGIVFGVFFVKKSKSSSPSAAGTTSALTAKSVDFGFSPAANSPLLV